MSDTPIHREALSHARDMVDAHYPHHRECIVAAALIDAAQKLAAAQAECAELKKANHAIAGQRDSACKSCADWDKALSSLAAMVMRYFKSINYRPSGNGDAADDLYHKCNKRGDDERALVNECANMRDENERMKLDLDTQCDINHDRLQEIEKLRDELDRHRSTIRTDNSEVVAKLIAENKKLREGNAIARKALWMIIERVGDDSYDASGYAQGALEDMGGNNGSN